MYICICNGITEAELRNSVAGGANSFEALQLETGVASCCGTCASAAAALLPEGCPGPAACHVKTASIESPISIVAAPQRAVTPVVAAAPVRWVSRVPRPVVVSPLAQAA